uniref:Uncharacterized protein n=1 Tax=Anguilla anguilla TaxID=7936 RepID=A0A0E9WLU5_ANGAN
MFVHTQFFLSKGFFPRNIKCDFVHVMYI